ncbi:MAG: hypothetical protein EBT99_13205 [Betaproteobacteria bacterium]|nr:hypothetical protein [Betaproteobacteria bacterium]
MASAAQRRKKRIDRQAKSQRASRVTPAELMDLLLTPPQSEAPETIATVPMTIAEAPKPLVQTPTTLAEAPPSTVQNLPPAAAGRAYPQAYPAANKPKHFLSDR